MCGMYLTTNTELLGTLRALNSTRASTSAINENTYGCITIGHFRARTSGCNGFSHPSVIGDTHLYHNGIIKNTTLAKYHPHDYKNIWDTPVLHSIVVNDFASIGAVDGSFACFYVVDGVIKFFRNHLSPLWIDTSHGHVTLSSVKFSDKCTMISAGTVYVINSDLTISVESTFAVGSNPFNSVLK